MSEDRYLLELAASDDVSSFAYMVEEKGANLNQISLWYGRSISGKFKMGFAERTPLMIASVYGSRQILKYIINSKKADVNKSSDSDGATALHCAAAGGSSMSVEVVKLLLEASADVDLKDHNRNKPGDLIPLGVKSSTRRGLEMLLKGFSEVEEKEIISGRKEYPVDVSMPDINDGVYGSDEFRMYTFKVTPCSRAYTHDWTECPFVHPGENARRRDLKKFNYTCVPCPEFRKGSCPKADSCEYAHGVFETWLHPAQYKTRLCKDETQCARKICFFAHRVEEMRPVDPSTGSALPSPKSKSILLPIITEMGPLSPLPLPFGSSPPPTSSPPLKLPASRLKTSFNARDLEIEIEQKRLQIINDLSTNLYNTTSRFEPKPGYGFSNHRSQSFVDRGAVSRPIAQPQYLKLSEWGSPDGKLDWGFSDNDANKLRKSASFGYGGGVGGGAGRRSSPEMSRYSGGGGGGGGENLRVWIEKMYMEREQMVAY